VPIGLPAWKDNTTQFIDGHYVGLCKQVNKNTEEYTGAMGWNNCIFSYYEKIMEFGVLILQHLKNIKKLC